PGFVMSLFALFHNRQRPGHGEICDALAGNLCRCTGYGPIIAAAQQMYDIAPFDRFDAASERTAAILKGLAGGEMLGLAGDGCRFFAPRTIGELAELCELHPTACLLAGGTDVGLWVTKQQRRLDPVIYVGGVAELHHLAVSDGHIEIGAAVTYDRLLPLLA